VTTYYQKSTKSEGQSRYGRGGEEKKSQPLPRIERWTYRRHPKSPKPGYTDDVLHAHKTDYLDAITTAHKTGYIDATRTTH